MTKQALTCSSRIEFGDRGDGSCTFHCQLIQGHEGNHKESSDGDGGVHYEVEWASAPGELEQP
jgi:hypothetical protein